MEKDGKIVSEYMTDEYTEFVKLLRKWYGEGLIDPEFLLLKGNQVFERFINSRVGTYSINMWICDPNNNNYKALKEKTPEAELKMIVPPKGPNGDRGCQRVLPGETRFLCISSKAPQPELLMKLLNYVTTDEGHNLSAYGIEGVHFRYHADENRIEEIPPYNDRVEKNKLGPLRLISVTDRRWAPKEVIEAISMTEKYGEYSAFYGQVPAMAEYADVNKIMNEATIRIIIGEAPLEELDTARQKWLKEGGEIITQQVNEAKGIK